MAVSELEDMTGPQKAAIMMLAMGDDRASRMFGMMDDEEIRELSTHMVNLGNVSSGIIEALLREFVEMMSQTGAVAGTFESTERLLTKGLGEDRVKEIMEELRGPAGRTMWDKLGNVNEEVLATYFKNEYPQTVSVVLSKIKSDHASRVLSALPEDFAMEVIMRMLTMEPVKKDVLDSIEQTLRTEFMSNLARTSRIDSHEVMAEIFNSFDRSTEQRFMSALEERSRDSAERIKSLMFTVSVLTSMVSPRVRSTRSAMFATTSSRRTGTSAGAFSREKASSRWASAAPRSVAWMAACSRSRASALSPSHASSRLPSTTPRRLLKSWTKPPVIWPTASILYA